MLSMLTQDCHANDLSRGHRFFLLVLVSIGSSIIYTPSTCSTSSRTRWVRR